MFQKLCFVLHKYSFSLYFSCIKFHIKKILKLQDFFLLQMLDILLQLQFSIRFLTTKAIRPV